MSKIIGKKGNQDFNGYGIITDLPVDKIEGKDFNLIQRQFTTSSFTSDNDFGSGIAISDNGLWLGVGGRPNYAFYEIYNRPNINSDFSYLTRIGTGGSFYSDVSFDGKYWAISTNAGKMVLYSRDEQTNVFTQRISVGDDFQNIEISISSDGNYVISARISVIYIARRTSGTDTWTILSTVPMVGNGNLLGIYQHYQSISRNAERFCFATQDSGVEIWRKTGNTSWVFEQHVGDSGFYRSAQMNDDGNLLVIKKSDSIKDVEIYERSGTTWTLVYSIENTDSVLHLTLSRDGNTLSIRTNETVNSLSGTIRIYKRITNTNWKLVNTIDSLVNGLGVSADGNSQGPRLVSDGSIITFGATDNSGFWVYDIRNEVEFEQRIKTKIINFNDTLKITSAFGSADHLVTFPSFNQAGSLINDGGGNCRWGEPFDQSLNKSDAVQFDTIGISPNLGQTTTGAELQLSFRKINESYSGNCIKLRRDTDFTVAYALDAELDDSSNLTGAATYNSTGGTSSRGQFTATLSTSGTFIVDGTSLGSGDDGTRILFVGQNNQDENGIYTTTISGTSLTLDRATDFDGDGEVSNGDSFYITNGTVYADTGFKITTEDSIVVGGTSGSNLTFSTIDVLKDIGFDPDNTGSGIINLATVSTMLEDDDGYIHTWYDQSGNSNDFTQTTTASQPQLLLNGGINWLPSASFDGTDDNLDAGDVLDIGTNTKWYVNAVTNPNKPAGIITKSTNGNPNRWALNVGSSGTIDWSSVDDSGSYSINGLTVSLSTTNISAVDPATGGITFNKASASDATLTMTFSAPINISIGFNNINASSEGFTNFSTSPDSVSINGNHSWDGTTLLYSSSSTTDVSTLSWVGISTLTFTYTYPPNVSTGGIEDSVFTFANAIYEDSVESTTAGTVNTGSAQIASFILDRNNGTQTLNSYINNSNIDTNVALTEDSTYNFNSTTSTLIGAIDGSGYFDGEISEIIIHSNLTNPERVGIEQEQANYYGITISEMPKLSLKLNKDVSSTYNLTYPASQGNLNSAYLNDGSGNLSYSPSLFRVRTETTGVTMGTDNILNMNNSGTETVNIPDATAASNLGVKYIIIKQTGNQVDVTSSVAGQLFTNTAVTTISLTGPAGDRLVLLCNGVYWYVM